MFLHILLNIFLAGHDDLLPFLLHIVYFQCFQYIETMPSNLQWQNAGKTLVKELFLVACNFTKNGTSRQV